jgi:hypothetical protein
MYVFCGFIGFDRILWWLGLPVSVFYPGRPFIANPKLPECASKVLRPILASAKFG